MNLLRRVAAGLLASVILFTAGPPERTAIACTGGVANLEWFAPRASIVVIGTAVEVGGTQNAAPTVTPTTTPASTAPLPPPAPTLAPFVTAPDFLAGIGATLRVERDLSHTGRSEVSVDDQLRQRIERELREAEAGIFHLSSCAIDAFVPRYTAGARYLVFAEPHGGDAVYAAAVFRVEGDRVVFDDPGLEHANNGFLVMERATYDRFFQGRGGDLRPGPLGGQTVYLAEGSVPLDGLLAAVAFLRSDPSIAPPETGSGGQASTR